MSNDEGRAWGVAALCLALLVLVGTSLVALGGGSRSAPEGLLRCEGLTFLTAPDEAYERRGLRRPGEAARREIFEWAADRPGYGAFWSVGERGDWIHVGVLSDLAEWQEAIAGEFPEYRVLAMRLPYSAEELEGVRDRAVRVIETAMADGSWGSFYRGMGEIILGSAADAHFGVARVTVDVLTPERLAIVEKFRGEPVCFEELYGDDVE